MPDLDFYKIFPKNPTICKKLKEWSQKEHIDLYLTKYFLFLYQETENKIKKFKINIQQFSSFKEYVKILEEIYSETNNDPLHPFTFLNNEEFIQFLTDNSISFKIRKNHLIIFVENFNTMRLVGSPHWCVSKSKKFFNQYSEKNAKHYIVINLEGEKENPNSYVGVTTSENSIDQFNFSNSNPKFNPSKEVSSIIYDGFDFKFIKKKIPTIFLFSFIITNFVCLTITSFYSYSFKQILLPLLAYNFLFSLIFCGFVYASYKINYSFIMKNKIKKIIVETTLSLYILLFSLPSPLLYVLNLQDFYHNSFFVAIQNKKNNISPEIAKQYNLKKYKNHYYIIFLDSKLSLKADKINTKYRNLNNYCHSRQNTDIKFIKEKMHPTSFSCIFNVSKNQ